MSKHKLHLDGKTLYHSLSEPMESFADLGETKEHDSRLGGRTIHIDRGASVLGVAHTDSVQMCTHARMNDVYLQCPTVDNRMGLWLMLHGLPNLGLKFDVLLTENEEMGDSTGQFFKTDKHYNWMFSFDRQGTDVVTYHYRSTDLDARIKSVGLTPSYGSYSDISDIDIGCVGLNFGCGMYQYHSKDAFVKLQELRYVVNRFRGFYHRYHATHMPYDSSFRKSWRHEKTWMVDDYDYGPKWQWIKVDGKYQQILAQRTYLPDPRIAAVASPPETDERDTDYDEWWYNHSLSTEQAYYADDQLEACDWCGMMFTPQDLTHVKQYGSTLCRRCLHWFNEDVAGEQAYEEFNRPIRP